MTEQCICGNVATVEMPCGLMICRSCKHFIDEGDCCDIAIDEIKRIMDECCEENCCKGKGEQYVR